ncbi:transcription termination factor MTERF8, chloroplastic-like [Carex rostrata]
MRMASEILSAGSSSPTAAQPPQLSAFDNVYESVCGENSDSLPPSISSSSSTQASAPNPPQAFAVQYLVQSCGLSSEKALKASKFIHHLKSPYNPDAVLRFLRENGISELDIKTAVSRESRILCSHVEKNWRPNITKLQELSFSIEDISGIIASNPYIFVGNFVQKIDFYMGVLGSVENLSVIFKSPRMSSSLFSSSLEKVLMPNLSFLRDQCGLSPHQITRLMKSVPRLISSRPDVFKMQVERVEKLGIPRSSGNFISALVAVSYQKQCTIDAKLDNLTSMGLSPEELAFLISKAPTVLALPEKLVGSKMEYLIKEAGCDKIYVLRNPFLLTYSLENRLIPRNIVRKLLMSKGLPMANLKFVTFATATDEEFVRKYVLPYEHAIPGLHRAYADASTGKLGVLNSFNSTSS